MIYLRKGLYEPGQRFYFPEFAPGEPAILAADTATAMSRLVHDEATYVRWEMYDGGGLKKDEGALNVPGQVALGDCQPMKFCALLRLASDGPGRPSVKYCHGISESVVTGDEAPTSFLAAVALTGAELSALGVLDSDGFAVTGALFRSWTWRHKVNTVI